MCDASVIVSDGTSSQELYFPDEGIVSCDGPHFSVQRVGNLDGDERLDLVTTFSPRSSYFPRRLFLSSAAPDGRRFGDSSYPLGSRLRFTYCASQGHLLGRQKLGEELRGPRGGSDE